MLPFHALLSGAFPTTNQGGSALAPRPHPLLSDHIDGRMNATLADCSSACAGLGCPDGYVTVVEQCECACKPTGADGAPPTAGTGTSSSGAQAGGSSAGGGQDSASSQADACEDGLCFPTFYILGCQKGATVSGV